MKHLVKYIRGAKELPLLLGANRTGMLKWWINVSYAVHLNLRGHSGGGIFMERSFSLSASTKHNLNTRSSTKSKIVGLDDFMPGIICMRNFLKDQYDGVTEKITFKYNLSALLLEKNGKASSGKTTNHIIFFVTNRVQMGEI